MKTIILALLLPCLCNAQKEGKDTTSYSFVIQPKLKPTWKVIDKNQKLLAEIDTAGHLKIFGDTLSVLKAIFKSHNVEIKTDNQ